MKSSSQEEHTYIFHCLMCFSYTRHFYYRAPWLLHKKQFCFLLPFPALRKSQGKLTTDSLNLGMPLISVSRIQFKRCLLGYKLLENRTWSDFEIINFLSQTFFQLLTFDWKEQVYPVLPPLQGCLLHQKSPIRLSLFTHGGGVLVSAEIREWYWRNPAVFSLSITALGQHP